MDNREFAEKIYTLRSEKGISQKELGDLLGVSNKAVSKWETGDSMPKTATLLKIAELFDIDISELMGGESRTETDDSELTNLKAENALLKSQIVKSDKKKKLSAVVVVILCVAAIAAAGVFAFFSGSTNADNKGVKDLGKDGTSISFAGRTFEPFTPLDEIVYGGDKEYCYLGDTKEAKYTDRDGNESTVLINCEELWEYITVSQGNKNYFYISTEGHVDLSADNIEYINLLLGQSVATKDGYSSYRRYSTDDKSQRAFVECFVRYYESKKEATDKRVTEHYLGNKSAAVRVSFNEAFKWYEAEIGEFFIDGKGKVYFYDYSDTKTYDVGKEMAKYVKGD